MRQRQDGVCMVLLARTQRADSLGGNGLYFNTRTRLCELAPANSRGATTLRTGQRFASGRKFFLAVGRRETQSGHAGVPCTTRLVRRSCWAAKCPRRAFCTASKTNIAKGKPPYTRFVHAPEGDFRLAANPKRQTVLRFAGGEAPRAAGDNCRQPYSRNNGGQLQRSRLW